MNTLSQVGAYLHSGDDDSFTEKEPGCSRTFPVRLRFREGKGVEMKEEILAAETDSGRRRSYRALDR